MGSERDCATAEIKQNTLNNEIYILNPEGWKNIFHN